MKGKVGINMKSTDDETNRKRRVESIYNGY
jgi:hypothetical protein